MNDTTIIVAFYDYNIPEHVGVVLKLPIRCSLHLCILIHMVCCFWQVEAALFFVEK